MKGTISPEMRALLNNKELFRKFNNRLLDSHPREPFCVSDSNGNTVFYTPFPGKRGKPGKRGGLLAILLGLWEGCQHPLKVLQY